MPLQCKPNTRWLSIMVMNHLTKKKIMWFRATYHPLLTLPLCRLEDGFFLVLFVVGFSFSVKTRGSGNGGLFGSGFSLTQA
jgi:hypothetical protein